MDKKLEKCACKYDWCLKKWYKLCGQHWDIYRDNSTNGICNKVSTEDYRKKEY